MYLGVKWDESPCSFAEFISTLNDILLHAGNNVLSGRRRVMKEVIRACKEDVEKAKGRVYVLQNCTNGQLCFCEATPEDGKPDGFGKSFTVKDCSLVLVHECSVIHLPFIMGKCDDDSNLEGFCKLCIESGCDINAHASQGVLSKVRKSGYRCATTEYKGKTALFYAIDRRCPASVKVLLKLGADCNWNLQDMYSVGADIDPITYVMAMSLRSNGDHSGLFEILDLLLERVGVDNYFRILESDASKKTVVLEFLCAISLNSGTFAGSMSDAVKDERLTVIEFFLKGIRKLKNDIVAFEKGSKYAFMLEKAGMSGERKGRSVDRVVKRGSSYAVSRKGPAFSLPDLEISGFVRARNTVFSACAEVEDTVLSLLFMAIYHKKLHVMEWLLEWEIWDAATRVSRYGYGALHAAAASNNVAAAELLLSRGASVEGKPPCYVTPVHVAALNGSMDVLKLFREKYSASVFSAVDVSGQSVAHYAASCSRDSVELIKYLFEQEGIDVNAKAGTKAAIAMVEQKLNKQECQGVKVTQAEREAALAVVKEKCEWGSECTPLHVMIESNNYKMAKFLLEAGLDCSIKNSLGISALNVCTKRGTLLHLAVDAGDHQFVKTLLKLGADPNVYNSEGRTPLDVAISRRDVSIINVLLSDKRQKLLLCDGKVEASCLYVLTMLGLLDDEGREIIRCRMSALKSRGRKDLLLLLGGISVIFMGLLVCVVVGGAYVLQRLGVGVEAIYGVEGMIIAVAFVLLSLGLAVAMWILHRHHSTVEKDVFLSSADAAQVKRYVNKYMERDAKKVTRAQGAHKGSYGNRGIDRSVEAEDADSESVEPCLGGYFGVFASSEDFSIGGSGSSGVMDSVMVSQNLSWLNHWVDSSMDKTKTSSFLGHSPRSADHGMYTTTKQSRAT